MRARLPSALLLGVLAATLVAAVGPLPGPPTRPVTGPLTGPVTEVAPGLDNPWLERRVLHIAHQGGEIEAPSDTLYAFQTALDKGADVLEMDVHATADGEVVVLHDTTVDRTTDGSGRVDQLTLAQIKQLDAAHWFVPGCGTCHDRPANDYTLRGYATGDRELTGDLAEFEPNDFTIPTLREVLERFPDVPVNIEIKDGPPDTASYAATVANLLAEFDRTDDAIVVAFDDRHVEEFKLHAPQVHTATATGQAALFTLSSQAALPGTPNPRYVALQVPITFTATDGVAVEVVTEDFVADAHANGLAVHVWTINDRATMEWLVEIGVDGIMTDRPTLLEQVLAERGVRWEPSPSGRDGACEASGGRAPHC